MTSMVPDNLTPPSVFFDASHIVARTGGAFSLRPSANLPKEDVFLVLDVYDLDNPVHPDGHLGWWSFRVDSAGDPMQGKLSIRGNRISVAMDGMKCFDFWANPNAIIFDRLVLNAVLRANTTNAIVHLDKVPVFRTKRDLEAFRGIVPRNWHSPPFAEAWFRYPRKATVRIVAPNIIVHDAVSNFCFDVYRLCKQNDIPVEIYAGHCHLAFNEVVRGIDRLERDSDQDDTLFYFFSTYDLRFDNIAALPFKRKIAYFHGITSPRLLQVFDLELSKRCSQALAQLPGLAGFGQLAANSVASARVLARATGQEIDTIKVVPPRIMSTEAQVGEGRELAGREGRLGARLLYVGRIKSHKKIEDLIELFAEYEELDPDAEYWIVGGQADRAYQSYLDWVVAHRFGAGSSKVRWFGNVSDEELSRLYTEADAYVSMSEDEGFCLPLVEAMVTGLPVFAYRLEAVGEVLGQAGIVFHEKDFTLLAASIHGLLTDRRRHERFIGRQYDRGRHWLVAMDGRGVLSLLDPSA